VSGALASFSYDRIQSRIAAQGTLALALALFAGGFSIIAAAATPVIAILGVALAGGGMGLLVPSLSDGVGEAVPQAMRGRLMGGLSTLRNLGRFASPLLAAPALVGSGTGAPFVGAATVSSTLALILLGWTAACLFPKRLREMAWTNGAAKAASQTEEQRSKREPALCQT